MFEGACSTTVYGEELVLLPERALYWRRTKALFVADLHLGQNQKAFRNENNDDLNTTLARLSHLLYRTQPDQLIIIGSLINKSPTALSMIFNWRGEHTHLKTFVVGDTALSDEQTHQLRIKKAKAPTLGPNFVLSDSPYCPTVGYALCGGTNPYMKTSTGLVQCFMFGANFALLPAFNPTISTKQVQTNAIQRVFAIQNNTVMEIGEDDQHSHPTS